MFKGLLKLSAALLPLIAASCVNSDVAGVGDKYYLVDYTHSNVIIKVDTGGFFPLKGRFSKFGGEFVFDPATGEFLSGEMYLKSNSVRTGIHSSDVVMRSPSFLDISKYPEVRWKSKRIEARGEGKYTIIADLTIRDKTIEVPFDAEFAGEGIDRCNFKRAAFSATGSISRADFGLGDGLLFTGGLAGLGDNVEIEVDISGALVSTTQFHYKCGNTIASRRHM